MLTPTEVFKGRTTDLDLEEPNLTMSKKLIICVAPTGSFTTREQNPYQPYTMDEVVHATLESVAAGASVWHVHCRDDKGIPAKDPEVIARTVGLVRRQCDVITSINVIGNYGKQGLELLRPIVDGVWSKDPSYIETAVITPYTTTHHEQWTRVVTEGYLKESVQYIEGKGIKCEFQIHNYMCQKHVEHWLIRHGIPRRPYIMNVVMGFHGKEFSAPTAPDPWGHIYLASMMNVLPPGCVVGLSVGGHNWLPMTVTGIMLGVDMVRVGMEDTIWMYPHKDEKIKRCVDVVSKVANIARELGRELATPAEARKILGLGAK